MSLPRFAWMRAASSGVKRVSRAVVDVTERDAVVVDARDRVAEREDLEAARVGEDRPVPRHEAMQAAELGDQRVAGPEMQVVRVAEHDLRAERQHLVRVEGLDGPLRADGHEGRRLDHPVRRPQHTGPRPPSPATTSNTRPAADRSRRPTSVTNV